MDDIEIYGLRGYNEIVGDSSRGMQHTLGANVSPALKAMIQRQAAAHAPATRGIGPQYKDSTQLPVNVQVSLAGTFGAFPVNGFAASATVRVQTPFKPEKLIASATFAGTTAAGAVYWQQAAGIASDVLLTGAFVGSKNCFPTAPSNNLVGGVNLGAYAPNGLGNGISWPTADAGIDITLNLLILPSFVSSYTATAALTAYTSASLFVTLLGPSLR
jgi:hypothetical protein